MSVLEPVLADDRSGGLLSGSALLIVANGLAAVFSLVYFSSLGHLMPPGEYGVVAAALSLGYLVSLVVSPLESGVAKFAAGYHALGDRDRLATLTFGGLRRVRVPTLAILVAWMPIAVVVAAWLHMNGPMPLLWLGALWAMSLPAAIVRGAMRGDHRFLAYGMTQVVESLVRLPAGLAVILGGAQAGGALFGYVAGSAAAVALGLWFLRDLHRLPPSFSSEGTRSMFAASSPLFSVYLFLIFVVNVDVVAARRFLSAHEAGLYGAAANVARIIYLGATPIYQVLFSRVAALHAERRPIRSLALGAGGLLAGLLFASFAIPWFGGETILGLALGRAYSPGADVLRILWAATSLVVVEAVAVFVLIARRGKNQAAGEIFGLSKLADARPPEQAVSWRTVRPVFSSFHSRMAALSVTSSLRVSLCWCC